MPTYVIDGYAVGSFMVSGGGALANGSSFMLDPNWSTSTSGLTFTVTDDDAFFAGSQAGALDATQTAVVTNAAGATVASGAVRLGTAFTISDPVGGPVTFYSVIVGAATVGYVSTAPLQPGVSYTVTSTAATTTTGVGYGAPGQLDYEQGADNGLTGGAGNDSLRGGAGNDFLSGGAGNDTILGGTGNDTISGGAGTDSLSGEDGDDLFLITTASGVDSVFGGAGNDTISYQGATTGATVNFTGAGSGTQNLSGVAGTAFTGIEGVIGTEFVDQLTAGSSTAAVTLSGQGGNDSITGGSGGDLLEGGTGTDSLVGNAGNDTMDGGADADMLFGGTGNDVLLGGAGADLIDGGTGNDTFRGGSGNDSLLGQAGDDTFLIDVNDGADTILAGTTTQTSGDVIDTSLITSGVTVTLSGTGSGSIVASGTNVTFSAIERVQTGVGNDTVVGGTGADSVDTGAGNDSLAGGAGSDTLSGGDGDDTLAGGAAADTLTGGAGNDVFVIGASDGSDSIVGGMGNDTLDVSGLTTGVTVTFTSSGAGTVSSGAGTTTFSEVESLLTGAGGDTITGGVGSDTVDAGSGDDRLFGGGGADLLFGKEGADSLEGGDGNDTVDGGAGADLLDAGDGNDSVLGGEGNDTITGGAGTDRLTGGAGADRFVLTPGGGQDVITDLDLTLVDGRFTDRIDVSALLDAQGNPVNWQDAVIASDGAGGSIVTFPGDVVIRLVGVDPALISGQPGLYQLGVPCFGTGTLILTERGEVPVEEIRVGDRVVTLDHGLQRVVWAGGRHLDRAALEAEPLQRPVLIRDGALGNRGDVLVSPNHAVLCAVDGVDMLVRAKHLAELDDPRFRIAKGKREVGYHHLLLERHGIVFAQGMATETMYPGPVAVAALGAVVAAEIAAAFPLLGPVLAGLVSAEELYGPTARPVAKRRQVVEGPNPRRRAAA